jgi:hypothetical protein
MTQTYRTRSFIIAALVLAALLPAVARAQATPPSDLRAIIRAELLSDPRTSSLTQQQLDAMVSLLSQEAQKRGLTAQDLTWHPQTFQGTGASQAAQQPQDCGSSWTCAAAAAWGFTGPDTIIPFSLGAASMALLWVIAEMLHRRKYPHLAAPASGM